MRKRGCLQEEGIMKDNKGFWDRWAKRYDFMMSGDGRTYAQIVSRMKKVLDREITVLEIIIPSLIQSAEIIKKCAFAV